MSKRLIGFGLVFIVAVVVAYLIIKPSERLPVFHPNQLDKRLVDRSGISEGEHHIKDFELIDQRGDTLRLADLDGKVIVADFFFTTCATICPKMSVQMARVQEEFKDEERLMLLSHSVTPEIDSVSVLAAYAELHGAEPDRWRLLTGDRAQIYRLARTSYFAALDEGDGGPDDFVHTENFVLVDGQRHLRGFYDGTSEKDVDRLIGDLRKLLQEEKEG